MIAQVLNREFVLAVAELARRELDRELERRQTVGRRRGGLATPLDETGDAELADLRDSLAAVTASDQAAGAGEEADAASVKDEIAFIPRDPLISLLQTTVDEHVEESAEVEVTDSPLLLGRRGPGDVPLVSDRRIAEIGLAKGSPRRRIFGDMEINKFKLFSDPGWLTSGFAMAVRAFRRRAEWVDAPPTIEVGERARIVLVGDWGSGLPRARRVAERIRAVLDEPGKDGEPVERHVVHLGDVYYSGSKREYNRNFLNLWPVREGEDIGSYSLCGNHDMYYGGHAYYGTCLADPRFARQSGCSYFALKSPHWTLIGLDSGYEDGGLHGDQAAWARQLIDDAQAEQRIALLSHHQLFSAHEPGAKKLGEKIAPVLATDRVDAWFWGHEHRCIQYGESRHEGHRVGFASCLGHGGVPEHLAMKETDPKPPAPWEYEYLDPFAPDEPWEIFGFAVLEVDGPKMSVRYIDENGVEHHQVPQV